MSFLFHVSSFDSLSPSFLLSLSISFTNILFCAIFVPLPYTTLFLTSYLHATRDYSHIPHLLQFSFSLTWPISVLCLFYLERFSSRSLPSAIPSASFPFPFLQIILICIILYSYILLLHSLIMDLS